MNKLSLNGEYKLHNLKNGELICLAELPGSDFGAYLKDDLISLNDAYFEETNSKFSTLDVYFERTFNVDDLSSENVYLHCDRIDTLCDIYLNGQLAATTQNAHISYDFNVK